MDETLKIVGTFNKKKGVVKINKKGKNCDIIKN